MLKLNERAWNLVENLLKNEQNLRIKSYRSKRGALLIDAGVEVEGSLEAGVLISRMLLSDLGKVNLFLSDEFMYVQVRTDYPLLACMASQYAGWKISVGKFYGMGSGPARVLYGKEPVLKKFGWKGKEDRAVLFIETRVVPPEDVVEYVSESCKVFPDKIAVVFAPTGSLVGSVQVPARVVETGVHKMIELGYEVERLSSAIGAAPVPPVGTDDFEAIGRTNDAVIYGGKIVYFVRDERDLFSLVSRIPSLTSRDYGLPFLEVFRLNDCDFYKIDPLLFSPAEVSLVSLLTGRTFRAGLINRDILRRSFGL